MAIDTVNLLVDDYDAAIDFFVRALDFTLDADEATTDAEGVAKRWVVVRPREGGTGLLLSRATNDAQRAGIGAQFAGKVGVTRLPLRDASVDAVYSTGVFEHIDDPLAAGAEVARVLKPGAKAVVGWAFMQPIHSEGAHFFNATPWGMQRAFAGLRLNRIWHETSFAFLVRWGAAVSDLVGRVPAQELEDVCATLARWDAMIPESHKAYMANGVWGEFEKA